MKLGKIKRILIVPTVLPLIMLWGCGSKDGDLCDNLSSSLERCDLIEEGYAFECDVPEKEYGVCVMNCIVDLECQNLALLMCAGDRTNTYGQCAQPCLEKHGFDCGNGKVIPVDNQCNGIAECTNGKDEEGCPEFLCTDGNKISAAAKCDGNADCSDGIDEADCPVFNCWDSTTIPAQMQCDGYEDCSDGSDEIDCSLTNKPSLNEALECDQQYFNCSEEDFVAITAVCDSVSDCSNGADEAVCVQ